MSEVTDEYYRAQFGDTLRELRKNARLSQDELAKRLGVSRTTITTTENGHNIPKAEFIESAFRLFHNEELVTKYSLIQQDKKELAYLATRIHEQDYLLSVKITRKLIRQAIADNDQETVIENLFQVIMWDLMHKGKVAQRKISMVIKVFNSLEPDGFIGLLDSLYRISYDNGKNFDAFIKITEAIEDRLKLDDKEYSLLLYQQATAYYYQGKPIKAHEVSLQAIAKMKGFNYPHTADAFHRHGLICLQLNGNEGAAAMYFSRCSELAVKDQRLKILATLNTARSHYTSGNYNEARKWWDTFFKMADSKSLNRINALNDITMMEIKLGNISEAHKKLRDCERFLRIAKREGWSMYNAEYLLWRRNKEMINVLETGILSSPGISEIINELENSHLLDELNITRNFLLERLLSSSTIGS